MALRPMRLTRKRQVEVQVKGGRYVNGRWEEDVSGDRPILANIQPFKFHEYMQLPESDRTQEWYKIYTEEAIETAQEPDGEGRLAERILWEDKVFKIIKVHHYSMGVLDHYKAIAVREIVSAGYG